MSETSAKKKMTSGDIVLAVLLLPLPILCFQMLSLVLLLMIPIALMGLIGVALFAVLVLIGGITMVGIGVSKIFSMPMGALSIAGYGFANIGIALLTECLILWIFTVIIPSGIRKVFGKNKEVKYEKTS